MRIGQKVKYFVSGLTGRLGASPTCPSCGSRAGRQVDRKYFHSLMECDNCGLLHRFPIESAEQMVSLYNDSYDEPGLTTELPGSRRLAGLLESGFKGEEKDFSYPADVLHALGIAPGMKLLDYGASWGYASWQFAKRGFDVTSFEISAPRAAFGAKIGLTIHTDIRKVGSGFDAVYSSHVLEHTPDPKGVLMEQVGLVKLGGLVIAHTPNGSAAWRRAAGRRFSSVWGFVHPVLLTDRFVAHVAQTQPYFVSSNDALAHVASWDRKSQVSRQTDRWGLFFAIRRDR